MAGRRDCRSAEAAEYRKMYRTAQWQDIRRRRLTIEPLCRICAAKGLTIAASVCDHIKPHRGDVALFFDFNNTQSLCAPCHDIDKGHIEAHGFSKAVGADGYPTDPLHPMNRHAPPARLH
jgi:5-methylcytosine-specific restriction protein A